MGLTARAVAIGFVLATLATFLSCGDPPCEGDAACTCATGGDGTAACVEGVRQACVCDVGEGEGEGDVGEGEGEVGEGEGEGEGLCHDGDHDGFYDCIDPLFPERPTIVDCNDRTAAIAPGGIEFPGNNVDDNCNADVDEVEPACDCDDTVTAAIGVCGGRLLSTTTEGLSVQQGAFADYHGVTPLTGDGCLAMLTSGMVDSTLPLDIAPEFDPFVNGVDVVQVASTDAGAVLHCFVDDVEVVPCSTTQDLTALEGPHVVRIQSVDAAGNVEPLPLVLAVGGPAVVEVATEILFPLDGDRVGERTPTITGLATSGSQVALELEGPSGEIVSLSAVADEVGGFGANPGEQGATLARGDWILRLIDFDPTTGAPIVVDERGFTVASGGDNVPPKSRIFLESTSSVLLSSTEDECDVVCTLDGAPLACDFGSVRLPERLTGVHVFTAAATDPTGNAELVTSQLTLTLFEVEPLAVVVPADGSVSSDAQISIVGTAPAFTDVMLYIDGVLLPPAVAQLFGSTASSASGRFVYPSSSMPPLTPGVHVLTAEALDFVTFELQTSTSEFEIDAAAADVTAPATIALAASAVIPDPVSTAFNLSGVDPSTGFLVNDPAAVVVELDVPSNALGFEVSAMFISVEWPEFLCNAFNDAFRLVVESDAIEGRTPTNVAFDVNNNPITVNVGFFELPAQWTTDLSALPQTGATFDQICVDGGAPGCTMPGYCDDGSDVSFTGSGSGWLTTRAPVRPGERLRLTFMVYDESDFALDSAVFLDGFRWLNEIPPIGTVKEGG